MTTFILFAFVTVIGLCIGSFLNVVILRAINNESIIFPPSKCPKCQHPLKWWHNIPVLSYILLKGKCGFCRNKISIQYPIIEILTAIIFSLIFLKNGFTPGTLYGWVISSLFIVLAATDWKKQIVYTKHLYALIGTGLIYSAILTGILLFVYFTTPNNFPLSDYLFMTPLILSLIGTLLGFTIMEIVARIGYLFAGDRAFGEGDSYIAAGLGAVFGWKLIPIILALSVALQVIITIPIFIKKEIQNKNWITLTSLITFIFYATIFFIAQQHGWLTNNLAYIISTLILCALGLYTCKEILTGIKNPNNRTYLPFGPALLLAGTIILLIY